MSIPDYQSCMLPLLKFLEDGDEHTLQDAEESIAKEFKLSPTERGKLLASGRQGIFKNRVGWARIYLKKALLLESPKRGLVKITARGIQVLKSNPLKIDKRCLEQWPEFVEFHEASRSDDEAKLTVDLTPETATSERSN